MMLHWERTQHVTDVILHRARVFQEQERGNGVSHGLGGLSHSSDGGSRNGKESFEGAEQVEYRTDQFARLFCQNIVFSRPGAVFEAFSGGIGDRGMEYPDDAFDGVSGSGDQLGILVAKGLRKLRYQFRDVFVAGV